MHIINFILGNQGLLAIQVVELVFFLTLAYILVVEWKRTGRHELRSKVVAVSSSIAQLALSCVILFLKIFFDIDPSQRFVPLISSMFTITTIVFLWHAFLYSSIQDVKRLHDAAIAVFGAIITVFLIIFILWNITYSGAEVFSKSLWFLVLEFFFLLADSVIIATIMRFKGKYRFRVIAGFAALFCVHLISIYGFYNGIFPSLRVIRAALPVIVPVMFGTVMYRELIDHLVNLNDSLKSSLSEQGALIYLIGKIDYTINRVISTSEEHIARKLSDAGLSQADRELFEMIVQNFEEVKAHLEEVDRKVYETMEKVVDYDDVMLK